jgi:hypothetical protein
MFPMLLRRLCFPLVATLLGSLARAELSLPPAATQTGASVVIVSPTDAPPLVHGLNARPANFSVRIYGGRNVPRPAAASPMFLFNTSEDIGHPGVQVSVLNALRNGAAPVEALMVKGLAAGHARGWKVSPGP